jgi:formylglycine-generating enzyme required for sulfatase activity
MQPIQSCPSVELLRRSLDPDDLMAESERQRIQEHVDVCTKGCQQLIEALLRDNTLPSGPGATEPPKASGASAASAPDGAWPELPGYEILKELGRGGMGVVYQARQTKLDRLVALKMILSGAHAVAEDLARFRNEAEAVARLQHPNIVQIYEVGEHHGVPYFSLEFCAGGSLDRKLQGTLLPPAQASALVETLAWAMQAAHDKGVIHRDLKPANVLLAEDGTPKVTDFGLAKKLDEGAKTTTGTVMGTPSYMAPEQAGGKGKEVGPLVDVYALGALLYECLTGRPPFRAATPWETLQQVVDSEPVPPGRLAGVPRDLETICLKCLAKEPCRRYVSAQALAEDLLLFSAGQPIRGRPVGWPERLLKWVKRRPAVAALTAAVVFVVLVGLVTSLGLAGWAFRERDLARGRLAEAQRANRRRVQAQVEQLGDIAPEAAPGLLETLTEEREAVQPWLRALWADETVIRQRRMRAGLALVEDPAARQALADWMIEVDDPREVLLVREVLKPYGTELAERLWKKASDNQLKVEIRFRVLVALAAFDPASRRWTDLAPTAVEQLLKADPLHLGPWMHALRPVRRHLQAMLADVFRGGHPDLANYRHLAATVLADFVGERGDVLAEMVLDADEKQFAVLFPKLKEQREAALAELTSTVERTLSSDAAEEAREKLAKQKANAAVALLKLNQPAKVWPLLKHSPDPRVRSYLIHRLGPFGADANVLVKRLEQESDVTIRRALVLSLGAFGEKEWPLAERRSVVEKLQTIYQTADDPGLHAAAEWLLRRWKQQAWLQQTDEEWTQNRAGRKKRLEALEQSLVQQKMQVMPQWCVNGQGQTMVVIPGPSEFLMGSPPTEEGRAQRELQHHRRIGRCFAIAAKAVTVGEYLRFNSSKLYSERYARTADCPMVCISWYDAAAYCNWLSTQEGLEKCYEQDWAGIVTRIKENYLKLTGYRLPTEAEYEYACRAETVTARYYGESEELLGQYAWYLRSSGDHTCPVGTTKPNDFGLFDMLGNVRSWCQERHQPYPAPSKGQVFDDSEDILSLNPLDNRVLRGGWFGGYPGYLRAADRDFYVPTVVYGDTGFRVARTLSIKVSD